MDRRDFFKALVGTAAAAALLPEIWTPTKAIFLPPQQGWWQPPLRIREVEQYTIANDEFPVRYDMRWLGAAGEDVHFHIDFEPIRAHDWRDQLLPDDPRLDAYRKIARQMFEDVEQHHGLKRSQQILLPLPGQGIHARYV
jgi:hypothetical protein